MENHDPLPNTYRTKSIGAMASKANMPLHQNDQAANRTTPYLEAPESPSKRDKLLSIPSKTKAKSKALLTKIKDVVPTDSRDEERHSAEQHPNRRETIGLPESPEQKSSVRKMSDKTKNSLHTAANAIAHPQEAAKAKITRTAASKISTVQRGRPSRSANVELLEAYDSLSRAESSNSSRQVTSDDEPDEVDTTAHRERIAKLEAAMENARVAWATSHVRRVRVVPKREVKLPRTHEYLKDAQKQPPMNVDWLEWLGHVRSERSFMHIKLIIGNRCCSTTRRTLVLNTLTILTSYHSTLTRSKSILRGP